jgi:hypothetical protein
LFGHDDSSEKAIPEKGKQQSLYPSMTSREKSEVAMLMVSYKVNVPKLHVVKKQRVARLETSFLCRFTRTILLQNRKAR